MWFARILLCGSIKCEANKLVLLIYGLCDCYVCIDGHFSYLNFVILRLLSYRLMLSYFGACHIIYMLYFLEILSISTDY